MRSHSHKRPSDSTRTYIFALALAFLLLDNAHTFSLSLRHNLFYVCYAASETEEEVMSYAASEREEEVMETA